MEWVGTAGYCENPTQSGASPPPYSLSLWCWWRAGVQEEGGGDLLGFAGQKAQCLG